MYTTFLFFIIADESLSFEKKTEIEKIYKD